MIDLRRPMDRLIGFFWKKVLLIFYSTYNALIFLLHVLGSMKPNRRKCRLWGAPDTWFLFRIFRAGQPSLPSLLGQWTGKSKTLTCSSAGHRKSFCRLNTYANRLTTSRRSRIRGASQQRLSSAVPHPLSLSRSFFSVAWTSPYWFPFKFRVSKKIIHIIK